MTKTATKQPKKAEPKKWINVDISSIPDDHPQLRRHIDISYITKSQAKVIVAIREELVKQHATLPNGSLVDGAASVVRYLLHQAAGEV